MKLLTYNILMGGRTRFENILSVLSSTNPDIVALQETTGFDLKDQFKLKKVSETLSLPYFEHAPGKDRDFSVSTFSRFRIAKTTKLKLLRSAALITQIECNGISIAICNVHLCPFTEDERMQEVNTILNVLDPFENTILVGDMNSISVADHYNSEVQSLLDEKSKKKFTKDGTLRFDSIALIESSGLSDVALHLGENHINTVPTGVDLQEANAIAHYSPPMRLDFVFASRDLTSRFSKYTVITTETAKCASDHFPICVIFQ